ncbi:MAG: sigma-54-dependent transcriptional regulator [Marinifilaceae bacterium]
MQKNGRILIVDDNKSVLSSLRLYLKHKFEKVTTCSNPNQIPALFAQEDFDVVLLDMNFTAGTNSGNEGLFWLKEILNLSPQVPVILITAYGDVQLAVNAMKEGATDFVLKPWDNKKLLVTLQNAITLRQTRKEVKDLKQQQEQLQKDLNQGFDAFLGNSPAMGKVFQTIQKVAQTDANVLILGENGTGKELVAREIHRLSLRSKRIFMGVDMGALSESLFESELFGHCKGAFTDAKEDRQGRFQTASRGTLFLDEIGNLSAAMQAKLLSALQNREVTPLGANKPEAIDVRLVCATNKKLVEMVRAGDFREDLLYRINTIQIQLPPLRDREQDVLLLARYFLGLFSERYGKLLQKLSRDAEAQILKYAWPGNVRELKHCMERAVILSDGREIEAGDLFLNSTEPAVDLGSQPMSLEEAEQVLIRNAMKRHQGNISSVAKELNIGRQTLYRKLEKYSI